MAIKLTQKTTSFWVIVAVSAVFACFLLLLPTLFSVAPFNKVIVTILNHQVAPARFSIEDISLGWLSHQRAGRILYIDEKAGVEADIETLTIEKNLLELLFNRTDWGFIRLESPRLAVTLKTIADFETERFSDDDQDGENPEDDKRAGKGKKPLGQRLLAWGRVSFKGGQIFGVTNTGEKMLLLDQVLWQTLISKAQSQATIKLAAKSGRNRGKVAGNIAITIPESGVVDKTTFVGRGRLKITDWDLEELFPLARSFSDQFPFGSGRLDGEWRMENPSGKELEVIGDFKAKDVLLYGGFLKKDQPGITQINCQLNALRQEGRWALKKLQFASPLASGTVSGLKENRINLDVRINIAPTLKQFPRTLNIRDDLIITNGSIQVSGKAAFLDTGTHFNGRLTLPRLEGRQDKRKFAWKKPLTITGQGRYNADRWAVEQAQVTSTFINGEINATPDKFKSRLTMDAAETFQQAGQFFKIPPIALQGFITADLTAQKKGNTWALNIDTSSEALEIRSANKVLSAAAPFTLKGKGRYQVENRRHIFKALQLILNSGPADGDYRADQMELRPSGRMLKMENALASGGMDNGKLGVIYAAVVDDKPKLTILGTTRYEAAFDFNQDQVTLHNIALTGTPFKVDNGRQHFSDQKVVLSGSGVIDVDKRSAAFAPVKITTSAGEAAFESFKLGNLRNLLEDMTVKGSVNLDLALLAAMDGVNPNRQTSLAGNGEAMLEAAWRNGVLTALSAKGIVAPFQWRFDDQVKIDAPKVVVDLEVGPGKNKASAINRLLVKSDVVSLNGTGGIHPDTPKTWLRLKGNADTNLEQLSHFLSKVFDQPVMLTGKKEAPFALQIGRKTDPQDSWLRMLDLKVRFPASRMTIMGVVLDQLMMPSTFQKGRAQFDLKAMVNGGKMTLAPLVDLNQEPRFTVGKGIVLKSVRITQSMVDHLLSKLHPAFVGATANQGVVDLYLEKFDWPLAAQPKAPWACDGQMYLNRVVVRSAGLLEEILALLKADRRNLAIESEVLTFSCRQGRVVTSPLTVKADDTTIILEGSVGFDQSLDFTAQTPISEKMVGANIYPYVSGSMLTIPIEGTATKPQINAAQFYAELEDIIKETGGKALKKEAEAFLKERAEGLLEKILTK